MKAKLSFITDDNRTVRVVYNPLNAWLPPRKSAKLVPKKEPAINQLNIAGMASSFKKFCDSHGYICS